MKKPNRFLAPIVIAGITVGFLASAYKFIIKSKAQQSKPKVKPEPVQDRTDSEPKSTTPYLKDDLIESEISHTRH